MKDNKFEKEIFEKIEEKKIKPKPKWEFLLKNYVVWCFGVLSLLIGSLAFSVIIYMLRHNDWKVYENINDSLLGFVLVTLPYFWIILLVLFIFAAEYNIRHTKTGYHYRLPIVVVASIAVSMFLGAIFYNIGVGQAIDDILGENAPFYEKLINRRIYDWNRPEEGRLMGQIIDKKSEDNFIIQDIKRGSWVVDAMEADIMPMIRIELGENIKIIGETFEDSKFRAHIIMPIGPGRGFLKRMPMNCLEEDSLTCPRMMTK